jgi:molecular chaperone DnaK (HSP70)
MAATAGVSDLFTASEPFAPAAGAAAPPFVPATPVANAFPMHGGPAPLLLDVTPQALGVETVDGYCESVIPRNAAIPVEKSRVFTTGADDQEVVIVRVMQGEARRTEQNQELGRVELSGLRRAKRGAVKIEVRFVMSADGTLSVQATDLETGRAQATRIQLVGGSSEAEIAQMAARQQALLQGPRA